MTETFKIWKNPSGYDDALAYMGEFYPPTGRFCFGPTDLRELGFPPGHYTIRLPDSIRKSHGLAKWQAVEVPR
jgi:hypothetical protein